MLLKLLLFALTGIFTAMKVSARKRSQEAFELALHGHDLEEMKRILVNHSGTVNPSVQDNLALIKGLIGFDVELVRMLVRSPRVPLDKVNPLYETARYGCVDVMRMLLKEPRIDPAHDGLTALREAIQNGNLRMVRLLLKDGRVDPADQNSVCLVDAVQADQPGILMHLLLDGRADPRALGSRAMGLAASLGRDRMVALFLADGRASAEVASYGATTKEVKDLFRDIPDGMYDETDPRMIDRDVLEWISPLQLDILLVRARNNLPMLLKLLMFKIEQTGLDSAVYRQFLRGSTGQALLQLASLSPDALRERLSTILV